MDHHQSQELQRLIDEAAVKPAQPTKPKKKTDAPIEDAPTGKCHPFFQTLHLHCIMIMIIIMCISKDIFFQSHHFLFFFITHHHHNHILCNSTQQRNQTLAGGEQA
jgi:hypothetical protein